MGETQKLVDGIRWKMKSQVKLEVKITDSTDDIFDHLSSLNFEITSDARTIKNFEEVINEQLKKEAK